MQTDGWMLELSPPEKLDTPPATQPFLFELPEPKRGRFRVYHDESLPERGVRPLTGHGLLYVPESAVSSIASTLRAERRGYSGEVHFSEIRGDTGQQERFAVASRWVAKFFSDLIDEAPFKATFAIHDGPRPIPYPDQRIAYLKHMLAGTRMTFVGLTRFALRGWDTIHVDPIFDATGNDAIRRAYERSVEHFAHRANQRRVDGDQRYPFVKYSPARFLASDSRQVAPDDQDDAELLQLTDILLGAAQHALEFRHTSKHSGRLQLARDVASGMAAHWGGSQLRYARRARNFTVTLWPDKFGFAYPALPSRRPAADLPRSPLPGSGAWLLRPLDSSHT